MSTSKTGKHGHAKVHLVATDIFTQKKLEELSPSTHNMDVPHVRKNEYSLLDIDEGFLSLMQEDGSTKDDVKVPDTDLGKKIEEDFEAGKDLLIAVTSAMGEEHVLGVSLYALILVQGSSKVVLFSLMIINKNQITIFSLRIF